MSAEIIQFGNQRPKPLPRQTHESQREAVIARSGTLTMTARNRCLRDERKEVWRRADAVTGYWNARLRFMDAASIAARCGLREEGCHRESNHEARSAVLESYRAALGKQLLTPAPDVASVNWKRAHMTESFIGVKRERIERVTADDMAFLSAHPTRNLKAKA